MISLRFTKKYNMKTLLFLSFFMVTAIAGRAQGELPAVSAANSKDFFIPLAVCTTYKLELGQADRWMRVYNNLAENPSIQRVNDIRWQAGSKEAAIEWYNNNGKMLNEGGEDVTKELSSPAGVDKWNVYTGSAAMKKMMKSLDIKQNQFYFTFTVDQYVGKIFISTDEKQTLNDAWKLAKEGVRSTLKATGKNKLADLLL
jgi:hypothetical protein